MNKLQSVTLAWLFVVALQLCAFGQSAPRDVMPCKAAHRIIAPKNPAIASDGTILVGQSIVQAQFTVGKNATVRIVEHPVSGNDLDAYHSTILVQHRHREQQYSLRDLIRGGEFLRIVETARLCSTPEAGTVFLAFESASTGASEGFVVVQYSPHAITVQALPPANQGRIVVRSPTEVELWTAQSEENPGAIECAGCKKRYAVEACHLGENEVRCSAPTRIVRSVSPDKFMRARIAVAAAKSLGK